MCGARPQCAQLPGNPRTISKTNQGKQKITKITMTVNNNNDNAKDDHSRQPVVSRNRPATLKLKSLSATSGYNVHQQQRPSSTILNRRTRRRGGSRNAAAHGLVVVRDTPASVVRDTSRFRRQGCSCPLCLRNGDPPDHCMSARTSDRRGR